MSALTEAVALAQRGFSVFPCLATKAPASPHGFHDATNDLGKVTRLWQRWPGPLIGVPTGRINGFDALDIDPRHGGDAWLSVNQNRLPTTRVHRTRSGGLHILFCHHDGIRNSAGRVAPGVDVRAEAGYAIWWPAAGCPVEAESAPADWPAWLLPSILQAPSQATKEHMSRLIDRARRGSGYGEAALRNAMGRVASAPQGQRNDTLNKEAFSLVRLAHAGDLSIRDIAECMAVAGIQAGLTPPEVQATLRSVLRSGGGQ